MNDYRHILHPTDALHSAVAGGVIHGHDIAPGHMGTTGTSYRFEFNTDPNILARVTNGTTTSFAIHDTGAVETSFLSIAGNGGVLDIYDNVPALAMRVNVTSTSHSLNMYGSAGATSPSINLLRLTTDSNPALALTLGATTTTLWFGAGGASGVDTNLYRSAANTLKTDDALVVVGSVTAASFTGIQAGDLPAHGASAHTDVTRSLWVPKAAMALDTGTAVTAGVAPDATDTANLADAATQGVYFTLLVPADFASSLSLVPYWLPVATDAVAHTVRWSVDYQVASAATDMTAAGTTAAWTGSSAARTANQLVIDTARSLTGGAANDVLRINLRRIGADAADTYVGDVGLVGVRLDYTATG